MEVKRGREWEGVGGRWRRDDKFTTEIYLLPEKERERVRERVPPSASLGGVSRRSMGEQREREREREKERKR